MDGMTQRTARGAGMADEESASRMTDPSAQPATKVDSVTIRPAANGGFIVTCSKSQSASPDNGKSPYAPPKDYAFTSLGEVITYLQTELGGAAPAPAAAGDGVGDAYSEA